MGKTIVTANHCLMDDPTTRRIAHHRNTSFPLIRALQNWQFRNTLMKSKEIYRYFERPSFRFQVTPVIEAVAGFVRV